MFFVKADVQPSQKLSAMPSLRASSLASLYCLVSKCPDVWVVAIILFEAILLLLFHALSMPCDRAFWNDVCTKHAQTHKTSKVNYLEDRVKQSNKKSIENTLLESP